MKQAKVLVIVLCMMLTVTAFSGVALAACPPIIQNSGFGYVAAPANTNSCNISAYGTQNCNTSTSNTPACNTPSVSQNNAATVNLLSSLFANNVNAQSNQSALLNALFSLFFR